MAGLAACGWGRAALGRLLATEAFITAAAVIVGFEVAEQAGPGSRTIPMCDMPSAAARIVPFE
jgi:hypothetical protein